MWLVLLDGLPNSEGLSCRLYFWTLDRSGAPLVGRTIPKKNIAHKMCWGTTWHGCRSQDAAAERNHEGPETANRSPAPLLFHIGQTAGRAEAFERDCHSKLPAGLGPVICARETQPLLADGKGLGSCLNGYKIVLHVGNPSNTPYAGFKLKAKWNARIQKWENRLARLDRP